MATCLAATLCECACCLGCSCISGIFNASLARAARFGHLLILLVTFSLAIWLGQEYPDKINGYDYYTKVNLEGDCSADDKDSCIYRQLIYRASFALFLIFAPLMLLSAVSDYVNRSLWAIKFGGAVGIFIAFWWVENSIFSGWAEFCRVLSFFWLLIQGLLLLDFSHDLHDLLMPNAAEGEEESAMPKIIYLGSSLAAFGAAIIGLAFLFKDYSGCGLGMFFIILTLVMGLATTVVSLLDTVQKGLLTPCIMFAYSTFMCWYALLSHPKESCNPYADTTGGAAGTATAVVSIISLVVLLYCVFNGTTILNVFNTDGEGVMMSYSEQSKNKKNYEDMVVGSKNSGDAEAQQRSTDTGTPLLCPTNTTHDDRETSEKSSGTAPERALFHVVMVLVSCYGAMILTNWGKTNGSPAAGGGDNSASFESMWLKIISQWVFLGLYWRVLHVAYQNNS